MTSAPRVVIGVPLYNHESKLREALDTLLGQTYRDFAVLLVDDGSTDATPAIAAEYVARDPRVCFETNSRRLGYNGNASRCFRRARELFPATEFFAWGSDHDVWHPRWLDVLVRELDAHPNAVLAFPAAFIIDETGYPVARKDIKFVPSREDAPLPRMLAAFSGIPMGNAIYGLFRAASLEKVPVLRPHLLPDRLLLTELALLGEVRPVRQYLFYRRYRSLFSTQRQIRASFVDGVPLYARLPWWLSHSAALFRSYVAAPSKEAPIDRVTGLKVAGSYLALGIGHDVSRARRLARKAYRERLKQAKSVLARKMPRSLKSAARTLASPRR